MQPGDAHVLLFWEVLQAMTVAEKAAFVNFCSGRSRLPASASDYSTRFRLVAPPPQSEEQPDKDVAVAQTCFFSLSLPRYSCREVCAARLRYAVQNAELMDADFNVRSASGWENIR